jgi:hypothetical protein
MNAKIIQDRDAKLKDIGQDKNEDFFVEKMAEVKSIADKTAEFVKKKADALESTASESTSEAADNSVKISQVSQFFTTSYPSSSIPPEDTSVLDHLASHCEGELPDVNL